ncbi:hypothetical protein [Luteimonas sp. 9C]|uniref:hypothetical protein n=1 Tax=Luteimonas sp. 9C TaxID=2653148 RepID=UPI0013580085|nr:hypothetical protein [Luteimonas sp. 9C]
MRGARSFWLAMALILVSMPSVACSWGDPSRRLQDEIRGYYDADVVFLARIRDVKERPPGGNDRFWTAVATYDVLEVYRGTPSSDGVVASEMTFKPGVDGAPPSSCTGGSLPTGSEGAVLLIFASRQDREDAASYYTIDRFNTSRIGACEGCDAVLERMRLYGEAEHVPLKQN